MTLILTHISRHGVVMASDSNLTSDDMSTSEGQKTFRIPHLNAALCVAGIYSVDGISMDKWMPTYIASSAETCSMLEEFSKELGNSLQLLMTEEERKAGTMIQIGGYHENGSKSHPEMWFVRNIRTINMESGEYEGIGIDFVVSEDFWRRDCRDQQLMEQLSIDPVHQVYVNGFASGRISFVLFHKILNRFFIELWKNEMWNFRPPNSLKEVVEVIKMQLGLIGLLFRMSNYPATFIGGDIQIEMIPAPSNVTRKSLEK